MHLRVLPYLLRLLVLQGDDGVVSCEKNESVYVRLCGKESAAEKVDEIAGWAEGCCWCGDHGS